MKKISIFLIALALLGCQATSTEVEPVFTSEAIEITPDELSNYWVPKSTKVKMLKKRPTWLPKGKGEWTVLTVIDSNGYVVKKTLISSVPEGFMTQSKIDEMPNTKFIPAPSNNKRTPVKFLSTAKIVPRSEL
ncbi:hypothetical protein FE810_02960 [Thalassotalea litorea]|uniref:TonB C-terminal domain-containing protein n=1 Tax=Thalassotalea litorea TaxID=2020715 RepID=A0A5R9IRL9_9GAMM|nr:hypothetical protein [Thalassotalea litorea]TLU67259.1 hypothetical protein FE810_02960 [Thalassotalea litorea]